MTVDPPLILNSKVSASSRAKGPLRLPSTKARGVRVTSPIELSTRQKTSPPPNTRRAVWSHPLPFQGSLPPLCLAQGYWYLELPEV